MQECEIELFAGLSVDDFWPVCKKCTLGGKNMQDNFEFVVH